MKKSSTRVSTQDNLIIRDGGRIHKLHFDGCSEWLHPGSLKFWKLVFPVAYTGETAKFKIPSKALPSV
jgi:hypothetical protein